MTIISLANERERIINIAAKHGHIKVNLKLVPRVCSQVCLAYIAKPPLAKMEICHYPGNARSKLWEYFGFYQLKEGLNGEKYMEKPKLLDFSIIIDDQSVGVIRLFPMTDCEI